MTSTVLSKTAANQKQKKVKTLQILLHRKTDPKATTRPSASLDPVLLQRLQADPQSASPHDVLQLQRLVGNRAAGRLLGRSSSPQPLVSKESREIQRALGVNNQIAAGDVTHVKELKNNTIFLLSGNHNDSLVVKIEILPSGHGNKEKWTRYKGRYQATQELALGVLDDTEAPRKLVLGDNELAQLLTVAQTPSPIPIVGGGFGSKAQQLKKDSEARQAADNQARQRLAQAIGWHQGYNGVMVKMENVGGIVDVFKEIGERSAGGRVKKGQEGEQLKALFTPDNVKKLGSVAYYDILTRNWDRFDLDEGPQNNVNMKEATGAVIGLDNINSAPGSHLSELGDQWKDELGEMVRFRNRPAIVNYAYMSLERFVRGYGPGMVEAWDTDEITKADLAMKFAEGFEEARDKASAVVMGWRPQIRAWKAAFIGLSKAPARNALMKAKEVIFMRQKIIEGSNLEEAQALLTQ